MVNKFLKKILIRVLQRVCINFTDIKFSLQRKCYNQCLNFWPSIPIQYAGVKSYSLVTGGPGLTICDWVSVYS